MEEQREKIQVNSSLELKDERLIPAEALNWYNQNRLLLTAELRRLETVEAVATKCQKACERDYYLALKHKHENHNYLIQVKSIFDNRQVVPMQINSFDETLNISYQLSNKVIGDLYALIRKTEAQDATIYRRQVLMMEANLELKKAQRETKDQQVKLEDLFKELAASYELTDYYDEGRRQLHDLMEQAVGDMEQPTTI